MIYKLNVKHRLVILSLLPKQGNLLEMTLTKEIKNKLDLKSEELKELNFKIDNNNVMWDADKDILKDFELLDNEISFIFEQFEKADKNKTLTLDALETYLHLKK